jgi:hypothetical protein
LNKTATEVNSNAQPKLYFMMEFKAVISVLYYVVSTRSAAPQGHYPKKAKPDYPINIIFFMMYIYTTHFSKSINKSVPTAVVGGIPNHNRMVIRNRLLRQ